VPDVGAPSGSRPLRRRLDARVARLRGVSATTPGRIGLAAVALLLLILLAGTLAAVGVGQRSAAMDHLVDQSEPRATAAQELYGALSDADATASRAFLFGGLEPVEVRQRYDEAIVRAQTALAVAARGSEQQTAVPITELATQLPTYVGLVETARVNNRQGFPVGAAYLRDASGLMRERLLPAANELYRMEAASQAADVDAADGFPLATLLLGLAVVAGMLVAQRYLTRRTNRLFNVGLLVATGAVAVWLLWSMIAMAGQVSGLDDSVRRGSAPMDVLAQAGVAARQARADETLTLVARGDGKAYEDHYQQMIDSLGNRDGGLIGRAHATATDDAVRAEVDSAARNVLAWREAHQELRRLDDGGQYKDAVQLAISPTDDSAGSAFTRLETDLGEAYAQAERAFNEEAGDARSALTGLVGGIVMLTAVAVAGAAWGLWQRLREYL